MWHAPLYRTCLSDEHEQRERLELMVRSSSLPHRKVVQTKGLLLAGGVPNEEIARRCETTPDTVRRWRAKFAAWAWTVSG